MPSMFDYISEYKKEIVGYTALALLATFGIAKGCECAFNKTKPFMEQILYAPSRIEELKKAGLKSSQTPSQQSAQRESIEPGINLEEDLEEKIESLATSTIKQPTPASAINTSTSKTPQQNEEYTIWIKDFSKNPDGTLHKISNATPDDLYAWTQASAGGLSFKTIKKLDLRFINYQSKSIDLIAGKPLQSIENGGNIHHKDNCNGQEYIFTIDQKQNEDADKMGQEDFASYLGQFGSAVIAKKDNKAMVFFGADATEVHYQKARDLFSSHDEFIVGSCPAIVSSGASIPPYMQQQNPQIIFKDRPVAPRGNSFPGAKVNNKL